jgi:dihydroorotase
VSTDLLIKDVTLADEGKRLVGDLYIRRGCIEAVGPHLRIQNVPVVNGEGRTLLPAFVDLHAHFRDPGCPEKEDVLSGSRAAAHGGYTAVSLMANTDPVCDRPDVAMYVRKKAEEVGLVEVFPVGAITRGLEGEALSDMEGLAPYVWAFSDDGMGVQRDDLMLLACEKAAALARPLISHCEVLGIPDRGLSEEVMAARDLIFARRTGCRLHIAHVSTIGALEELILSKQDGAAVTCEVTPHHLCLDETVNYTVNPPLVSAIVREALVQGLIDGKIDVIATDHAPHTPEAKQEGAPGISGIETAFSLLYSRLVRTGRLSLPLLSRYLSFNPACILGLRKGAIRVGYDGDIVLVEEDERFKVKASDFVSKSANTPLVGSTLFGKIWATVHRGEVTFFDGRVKGRDFDDHRQVV